MDLRPDSVRDEKVKVLKSIAPIGAAAVGTETVRAQYAAGHRRRGGGARLPRGGGGGPGTPPARRTRRCASSSTPGAGPGCPFLLRTGKRLSRRATEISMHFKRPPARLFADGAAPPSPNVLVFRIQPREGIMLGFNAKIPGPTTDMRTVAMDFSYGSAFGEDLPEAYERLLLDAMVGDSTLFMRKDEVEAVVGVRDGRARGLARAAAPRRSSPTGRAAQGPAAAERLLGRRRRPWRRL